ncbi:Diguanylate cyclase [Sulfidibacter corallicola]|uniref:diguanylate cyclase n=1 Tax=Sulfidibacter corallicola TaxID=2818388 RepID=A0A8A4TJP2_SULCO|nr:diguanylate cyclase [Sulfidibacter corallicola]QTD50249.1 diguanylate cyclase [Sulfidibacter corallicola]
MITVPKRQRVMIVDDIPANIKILGQAIRGIYDVSVATNGLQALQLALEQPPDLILLDILMPDMDGYETCRRLKSDQRTRDIPIIFVTSKDEMEDETLGLELGAVDYITKPFHLPIVLARVKTHLRLKKQSDLLETLASLDPLTEIPNRRQFEERLHDEWRRGKRSGHSLGLIMIDVDHFKGFNDHYGHARGDECLKAVARALSTELNRPEDLVARYGGEEFAAVLPSTGLQGAVAVGESMRRAVQDLDIPHEGEGTFERVTVSVGAAAMVPDHESRPVDLLLQADSCLYQAKADGRNQVCEMICKPSPEEPAK